MADAWIRNGDTGPTLRSTVLDRNGDRVDLAGTTVTLHMRPIRSPQPVLDGVPVDILQDDDDETTFGDVEYVWEATIDAGGYYYFWRVTFDDAFDTVESFPNDRYLRLGVPPDIIASTS